MGLYRYSDLVLESEIAIPELPALQGDHNVDLRFQIGNRDIAGALKNARRVWSDFDRNISVYRTSLRWIVVFPLYAVIAKKGIAGELGVFVDNLLRRAAYLAFRPGTVKHPVDIVGG